MSPFQTPSNGDFPDSLRFKLIVSMGNDVSKRDDLRNVVNLGGGLRICRSQSTGRFADYFEAPFN
jgi:hypothetical protein